MQYSSRFYEFLGSQDFPFYPSDLKDANGKIYDSGLVFFADTETGMIIELCKLPNGDWDTYDYMGFHGIKIKVSKLPPPLQIVEVVKETKESRINEKY